MTVRHKVITLMTAACAMAAPVAVSALRDPGTVAGRLESAGDVTMRLSYEVLLPSADDPVTYDVTIAAHPVDEDPLCHSDYLIEWTLPTPSGITDGFAAYAGGHHYRYRNHRLQEYHWQWDSVPFVTAGGGVQRNAQFAELTPRGLALQLREMLSDTTWHVSMTTDTLCNRRPADVLHAVQSVNGYAGRLTTWVLDPVTSLPRIIEVESNPGSVSEQILTVRFDSITDGSVIAGLTADPDAFLTARYPEVFAECRESNFAITSMPGKPLPSFSVPTTTGERYSRQRGDAFAVPTVIWVLDPDVACTPDVISATRRAVDALPMSVDVIYAYVSNDIDAIEAATGEIRTGEHMLMSAKGLARDCGVTACPSALICDTHGNVTDVILGFNKSLTDDVMLKAAGAQ